MNVLPVGPIQVADADSRKQYFDDLERNGFDIACNCYKSFSRDDVVGKLRNSYEEFASEAHRRGYVACIQIETSVSSGDITDISEAQYDLSNQPVICEGNSFYVSFSSDVWKNYLKDLISIFVGEYGYDYVLLCGPVCAVDIPGSNDCFYKKYVSEHSGDSYPLDEGENALYLKVKKAKTDSIVSFYTDVIEHAKTAGAIKTGIMESPLASSIFKNDDKNTCISSRLCQIAKISGIDFIIAELAPDCGNLKDPEICYSEIMARSLDKELLAAFDFTGCLDNPSEKSDLFIRNIILSAIAGAPCGFSINYEALLSCDKAVIDSIVEVSKYANRLGRLKSPVAFVFSDSGMRHTHPLNHLAVFNKYWALVKQFSFNSHIPFLTFHAETLAEDLAKHPETQVLILEEHFPLNREQMMMISNWWEVKAKSAIVAFGSGVGYSDDVNLPDAQPVASALPGVLELIGLKQENELQYNCDAPVNLRDVARVRRSAFLGENTSLNIDKVANLRRIFGSRANILYEIDADEPKLPVVAEWHDRSTVAIFCGFGLSDETSNAADKAVKYALREVDAPHFMIDSCSDGVLWSINRNDYIVIVNISDEPGKAIGRPGRANFWDCNEQKLLPDGDPEFLIEPHSFKVFRVVGRRSKFLDILGPHCMKKLTDGAGRAEMDIIAGQKTVFVLRDSPKEIYVDGKASTIEQEIVDGVYHVTLLQCPPGDRQIALKW